MNENLNHNRLLKFFSENEDFFDEITKANSIDDSLKYIQKSFPDYTLGEFIKDLSQLQSISISESEQLDLEALDKISGGLTISKPFLIKTVATVAGILTLPVFTGGQTKVHAGGVFDSGLTRAFSAKTEHTQSNIKYKLFTPRLGKGGPTAEVTGVGTGEFVDGKVNIPDQITVNNVTYTVTEINEKAFVKKYNVKEVTIPKSIKTIGKSAFADCRNLVSVTFAEDSQLTAIKMLAFVHCHGLKSIIIPKSVRTIEKHAFGECSHLQEILFNGDVSMISIDKQAVEFSESLMTAVPADDSNKIENTKKAKAYSFIHQEYQRGASTGRGASTDNKKIETVKNVFDKLKNDSQLTEKERITQIFTYYALHSSPADAAVEIVKLATNKESAASKITAVTYKVPGLQETARSVREQLDTTPNLLSSQKIKRRMFLEDIRVKSTDSWNESQKNGTLDVTGTIVDISDKQGENIVQYASSDPLFKTAPSSKDIRQGCIGDCFLLSSLSALLARDQNIIINSMKQTDNGEEVVVKLWHFDKSQSKAVPDYYKVKKTTFKNTEGKMVGNSEPWVNVFTKAFVAHAARYPESVNSILQPNNAPTAITEVGFNEYISYIDGGLAYDSMSAISGHFGSHARINYSRNDLNKMIQNSSGVGNYSDGATNLFKNIRTQLIKGNALTASGEHIVVPPGTPEPAGYMGFAHNHAYAILDTLENQTTNKHGVTRNLKLIQIQNPWGTRIPHYQKIAGEWKIAHADTNLGTDGLCWVDLNDFLRFFESIDYCKLNNANEVEANQRLQTIIQRIENTSSAVYDSNGRLYINDTGEMKAFDPYVQAEIDWLNDHGYAGLAFKVEVLLRVEQSKRDIIVSLKYPLSATNYKTIERQIKVIRDRGYVDQANEIELKFNDKKMTGLKDHLISLSQSPSSYDFNTGELAFSANDAGTHAELNEGITTLRDNNRGDLAQEVEDSINKQKIIELHEYLGYTILSTYYDLNTGKLVFLDANDQVNYDRGIATLRDNNRGDLKTDIEDKFRQQETEQKNFVERRGISSKQVRDEFLSKSSSATESSEKINYIIQAQVIAAEEYKLGIEENIDSIKQDIDRIEQNNGDARRYQRKYESKKKLYDIINKMCEVYVNDISRLLQLMYEKIDDNKSREEIDELKEQILAKISYTDTVINEQVDPNNLKQMFGYDLKMVETNSMLKDLVRSA
ncbi:MAG: leucine-rich repeat protein [Lactobacillales bacterium]|jgi:hypothetical protein|nr:leucine-rich repeat protein [Lactobacillales bacterium]